MRVRTRLLPLLLLIGLSACGGEAGGLFETMAVARAAEAELYDTHGFKCSMGFNIVNGRLAHVTVAIEQAEAGDLTVDDLARLIKPVVVRHFKEEPEALVLAVTIGKQ